MYNNIILLASSLKRPIYTKLTNVLNVCMIYQKPLGVFGYIHPYKSTSTYSAFVNDGLTNLTKLNIICGKTSLNGFNGSTQKEVNSWML